MLTGDIKSNRYRVHSIFTGLDDAQDKEDMLFILKQLATEELLSPGQFITDNCTGNKRHQSWTRIKISTTTANCFEATVTDLVERLG